MDISAVSPKWARLKQALRRPAEGLLQILLILVVSFGMSFAISPHVFRLIGQREWMTAGFLRPFNFILQMLVAAALVAALRKGPSLRTLFAPHWGLTFGLAATVVGLIGVLAFAVNPGEFLAAPFYPMNPFTAFSEFWAASALSVVSVALYEELTYRGVYQPQFEKLFIHRWIGMGVIAVLFTVGHEPGSFMLVFPGALLFGYLFIRTGSIVCTTVLHAAMNASFLLLFSAKFTLAVFLSQETYERLKAPLGLSLLLILLLLERRHRRHLPDPPR